MTKVCVIGDLHLGARNGSNHFSDHFNKFFEEVFFPYMKKNKIKHVIQLGDAFDNRTSLSYKAFHRCRDVWSGNLKKHGVKMYILLGNHDIHYRNTLHINSPELLLSEFKQVEIINKPTVLDIEGTKFDIIPWICEENTKEISEFIKRPDRSSILCGHLELGGFPMYKGVDSHGGMSSNLFDDYSLVLTGHYHTYSQRGNIVYTGIPYEITWSDYGDQKGFFVFDTDTNKLERVDNPHTMFRKIYYKDGSDFKDFTELKGRIVKVIVSEKKDPIAFERFIDSIKLVDPYDLTIIEGQTNLDGIEADENLDLDDTRGIIDNYIDAIEVAVDKKELKNYVMSLLVEAQNSGD